MRHPILKGAGLLALFTLSPVCAQAAQFSYLDPAYQQEIYTGPFADNLWQGMGLAWQGNGALLLRGNNNIYEYSLTQDTVYNGTNVHSYAAHAVTGLGAGSGMTNGLDGYVYANTESGLQRVNTATWTASSLAGTAAGFYGIGTLADGRIVYNDASWGGNVYAYNPADGTNTHIYSAGTYIDGMAVSPTGEIFLAEIAANQIGVIKADGTVVNTITDVHHPDGMAFGNGAAYAANNDGTVTRYDFAGPGYTGAATETLMASGGSYGDQASVGPDGAFYINQLGNGGWGLSHWDNGINSADKIVVRLSLLQGGFDPGAGVPPTGGNPVPEPGTLLLTGSGLAALAWLKRRRH